MNLVKSAMSAVAQRLWNPVGHGSGDLRYAAEISIWVRWVFLVACIIEANYRVEYGAVSHIVITTYFCGMMVPNAYVQWRIRSIGRVDLRWLFVLSVIDAATLTGSMMISGGFDSRYFAMYYFALALFAWVFASPYLVFTWTTIVAVRLRGHVPIGWRRPRLRADGGKGAVLQAAGDVRSRGVGQPYNEVRACAQAQGRSAGAGAESPAHRDVAGRSTTLRRSRLTCWAWAFRTLWRGRSRPMQNFPGSWRRCGCCPVLLCGRSGTR